MITKEIWLDNGVTHYIYIKLKRYSIDTEALSLLFKIGLLKILWTVDQWRGQETSFCKKIIFKHTSHVLNSSSHLETARSKADVRCDWVSVSWSSVSLFACTIILTNVHMVLFQFRRLIFPSIHYIFILTNRALI